jgi:hypothetical protein
MTDREKAIEIANNLNNTITKMNGQRPTVIGSGSLKNSIFKSTKPTQSTLQKQLDRICARHNIAKNELKHG